MKPKNKEKIKKLGSLIVKGGKETEKFVSKYGPKVHAASRRMSETAMDSLRPSRTRTVVDLTVKRKPKRVAKGRKGFYLDYT